MEAALAYSSADTPATYSVSSPVSRCDDKGVLAPREGGTFPGVEVRSQKIEEIILII